MNEFTKDELQNIYELMDMNGACRLLELKAKVKSMIDNYCDHSFLIPNFGIVEHCTKCSKLVRGKKLDE